MREEQRARCSVLNSCNKCCNFGLKTNQDISLLASSLVSQKIKLFERIPSLGIYNFSKTSFAL